MGAVGAPWIETQINQNDAERRTQGEGAKDNIPLFWISLPLVIPALEAKLFEALDRYGYRRVVAELLKKNAELFKVDSSGATGDKSEERVFVNDANDKDFNTKFMFEPPGRMLDTNGYEIDWNMLGDGEAGHPVLTSHWFESKPGEDGIESEFKMYISDYGTRSTEGAKKLIPLIIE